MHPLNHDSVWSLSHISHTEFHLNQFTEQSVHIPGNGSTCITWSWEKIVSWESDGGSWMGIMRKSKILVAGSMWEYTTRPKHDNCTYVLKRWLGGEEIILNFSFVKNFFISLPLKFWNGNISLSCVWSFPPLPPPPFWQIWSKQHILVLYMTIKEKFMAEETTGVQTTKDSAAGPIVRRSMAVQL